MRGFLILPGKKGILSDDQKASNIFGLPIYTPNRRRLETYSGLIRSKGIHYIGIM